MDRPVRIGIDFDNTLVSYDALFHAVAREWQVIPEGLPASKLAVRDYLRRQGQEDRWTEMQGYVYGARMDDARAYPDAVEFIEKMLSAGHRIDIVSHKTRHPFRGPAYDLHVAARGWIEHHLTPRVSHGGNRLQAYFELTKKEKLARIAACGCEAFVDDLPEILLAEGFPKRTAALLFDPDDQHDAVASLARFASWKAIDAYFSVR